MVHINHLVWDWKQYTYICSTLTSTELCGVCGIFTTWCILMWNIFTTSRKSAPPLLPLITLVLVCVPLLVLPYFFSRFLLVLFCFEKCFKKSCYIIHKLQKRTKFLIFTKTYLWISSNWCSPCLFLQKHSTVLC